MTRREVVRVRDVAQVIGGATPRTAEPSFWGGAIPWLTPKDLSDRPARYTGQGTRFITDQGLRSSSARLLSAGSILLTSRAPIGLVTIASAPIATNQGFKSLVLDETQSPEYWYYLLAASGDYLHSVANGSTFLEISGKVVGDLEFEVPSLDEQRHIAQVLGALDDLIDTNERLASQLDDLFQNLWSTHFELGGEENTQVTLGDLCTTQYGHTASATKRATDVKLLRVTDINKRNWIQWDEVPNCEADETALNKYRLNRGDLVVARMADPGKSAIVEHDVEAVFASYLVRLIPARRNNSLYLFGFLKSRTFLEYSQGAMTGSVQKHMNAKVIAAAQLMSPSQEQVDAFNQLAWPIRDQLAASVQEAQELRRTRDELLPLLVSGAVRVRPEGVAA